MQGTVKRIFAQDSWQTPKNARTLAAYMALQNREIGERIAALRKTKGNPPQEVVAQKLDVSNRAYQSWEAGDTKPSWRNLTKLARFYGTSEEFILLGDIPDEAPEPTQIDRMELQLAATHKQLEDVNRTLDQQALVISQLADALAAVAGDVKRVLRAQQRSAVASGRRPAA